MLRLFCFHFSILILLVIRFAFMRLFSLDADAALYPAFTFTSTFNLPVNRPRNRGEDILGRKNKNGRSRPHVNKYINQKGRLLRKQSTTRPAVKAVPQQQETSQQMVQRFEIWFAELGDHFGSSVQSGSRPVLVISNDVANRFSSTLTVIPLTTVQKKLNLPTHIQIAEADCQMINDHAYLRNSVALAEQVTTIGKNALLNKLGCLTSTAKQREVEQAIAVFFNMGTVDTTTKEARTW